MCFSIIVNKEVTINTPKEFVDYFKVMPVKNKMYREISMEACLCQIDIPESLRNAGCCQYDFEMQEYYVEIPNKNA